MNKTVFLVESKNYDRFIEAQKDFYGDDYEKQNDIVIVINNIEFVDGETFRIEHGNIRIDNNDLYLFEGTDYGYYNMIFANGDYTYYCLDGCWYN